MGDEVEFDLEDGALRQAMTSPEVNERYTSTMNAQEFCEMVEVNNLLRRLRSRTMPIAENDAPLISLKESGRELIFEPSFVEGYAYLVRDAVLEKLVRIDERLESESKVLIIRSAWRSFRHQRLIWDARVERLQQENPEVHASEIREMASYFIAPETKSMHATGGAVDVLIYDRKKDCVMDFGTNEGLAINLGRRCYPGHPDISPEAKSSRDLLIGLFADEGFVCDLKEFWHFDYGNVMWAVEKDEVQALYGVVGVL